MIIPLKRPNLPDNKVCDVAVSNYSIKLINKLEELNINPILTINSDRLDKRVCYHTDMLINNISGGTILLDYSQKNNLVKYLTKGYRCKIIDESVKNNYPEDSLLNAVVVGDKLICNKNTVHHSILDYADKNRYNVIHVNQGYTKCSICIVSDNALITDDESIYNVSQANNIDSLYISKGSVQLKGFDYGFIGGCTGLIDKDKLLFNGDLNYHKDCNRILDFLSQNNIKPIIIENEPLTDIGSIIPLTMVNTANSI